MPDRDGSEHDGQTSPDLTRSGHAIQDGQALPRQTLPGPTGTGRPRHSGACQTSADLS
jgi:hypothetical protein